MNARILLAGLIVIAGATQAQAQGLLQKLGKIAKEAVRTADQLSGGAEESAAAVVPADLSAPGYLGMLVGEPAQGTTGMPVLTVRDGSPAADAGFRPGDLVSHVDGNPVATLDDFQAALADFKAGDRVRIKYVRDGATQTVAVKLATRPATTRTTEPAEGVPFRNKRDPATGPALGQRASLGVTVVPLTDEARRKYGLEVARGALVTAVRAGGPAEAAGIGIGTTIVAVDGKRIDGAEELIDLIAASRPGQDLEVTYYVRERLFRKTIKLGASDGGPAARTIDPTVGEGERPLLRKVLDNIGGAGGLEGIAGAAAGAGAGNAGGGDSAELRKQIDQLQVTIERLSKRVQELEAKLGTVKSELPAVPPPASPFDEEEVPSKAPPLVPPKKD